APGDSGQNESERSNAAIGDALMDVSSLKWQYYGPLDGLTSNEINNLTIPELASKEEECMERNAWKVAEEITQISDDELGPAGDFMKCFVTPKKENQFFFNTRHLIQYTNTTSEAKRKQVQFREVLISKQSTTLWKYTVKPYPDANADFHYLLAKEIPTNRSVDDFHLRVQIKRSIAEDKSFYDNPDNVTSFSNRYVLPEELVQRYVDHLKLLELRREKRSKERKKQADLESKKTYNDYNWTEIFLNGSLKKLTNAVLDKFIDHQSLRKCSSKKERFECHY
ncbi:RNA-directed DNA polymerase from transposon X-element, partial [Paramuricea clavata]